MQIISNLGSATRKTLNGRHFLVAEITLIKEGVLDGNQGPIFYPSAIFNAGAWNGIPIIRNHPESGSARNPEVYAKQHIGTIFNARTNGDRLQADGWFDAELTQRVDYRIFDRLSRDTAIEVSTGVDLTLEKLDEESIHNGVTYNRVVTELQPDHLAVLLDNTGACSVDDGCGIHNGEKNMKKSELVDSLIENSCCWDEDDREILSGFTNAKLEQFSDALDEQSKMEVVYNKAVVSFKDVAGNEHTFNQETKVWDSKLVKLTDEQWMEKAPDQVKNLMADAEKAEAKEKAEIIEKLTENVEDKDEVLKELNNDSVERLRKLVVLAAKLPEPVSNFSGQAEVPSTIATEKDDILPVRQTN